MKSFLDSEFLLTNTTAQWLYHEYAEELPIIDYHCHLDPALIASDHRFENLTRAWLAGDHYKWRAMRTHGVPESYITGQAPDEDKFMKWAETVPFTIRNPLYHWTHLELRRYFDIHELLSPETAAGIYRKASHSLQEPEFSVRRLLQKMRVQVVCTTDDPVDSLEPHRQIAESHWPVRVMPAWRPDKALAIDSPITWNQWIDKLSEVSGTEINSYQSLLEALQIRHAYFHLRGCRLSDHGIAAFYSDPWTDQDLKRIFTKARAGQAPIEEDVRKFRSALLYDLAVMDHSRGWVQQYHVGALRNTNTLMMNRIGPDSGYDSIGDEPMAKSMAGFLDRLNREEKLAKTILYNLNPRDNEVFATMCGNFQDGSVPGKIQWGSGWWFLDQKDGMEKQLNALSNLGLLSRFIGMLTDSRSFLSFPRHEYFRRILCNLIGTDVERGELPDDLKHLGRIVQDICYFNALNYFNISDE